MLRILRIAPAAFHRIQKLSESFSAVQHAEMIAGTIPRAREDVIVVAHSASGLFLPLVAGHVKVRRLVFLAAVIPQIGKSLLDQFEENPDMILNGSARIPQKIMKSHDGPVSRRCSRQR
jgi:hypothetical protein